MNLRQFENRNSTPVPRLRGIILCAILDSGPGFRTFRDRLWIPRRSNFNFKVLHSISFSIIPHHSIHINIIN